MLLQQFYHLDFCLSKKLYAFVRGHFFCADNLKLSKKRAKYVYQELIKMGINQDRLSYQRSINTLLLINPESNESD